MIVDIHTHTPSKQVAESEVKEVTVWRPDKAVKWPVDWDDYMEAMEPVDKSIVFGIAELDEETGDLPGDELAQEMRAEGDVNDDTAHFVRAHPDKLIGFMSVHPRDPGCLDEIDRCVSDLGLRGLKLGPNYQNFDL